MHEKGEISDDENNHRATEHDIQVQYVFANQKCLYKKTTNEHKICRIIKTNKELKGAQCSVPTPQMLVETM